MSSANNHMETFPPLDEKAFPPPQQKERTAPPLDDLDENPPSYEKACAYPFTDLSEKEKPHSSLDEKAFPPLTEHTYPPYDPNMAVRDTQPSASHVTVNAGSRTNRGDDDCEAACEYCVICLYCCQICLVCLEAFK